MFNGKSWFSDCHIPHTSSCHKLHWVTPNKKIALLTVEVIKLLTLKAPNKICSRQHSKIFIFYFSEKTSLDISCESSAWQMIHMKCQDLFSSENKKKKSKLSSALVVIGALSVKFCKISPEPMGGFWSNLVHNVTGMVLIADWWPWPHFHVWYVA